MSNHLKIPGSGIEALLDHKLGLFGVEAHARADLADRERCEL